MEIVIVTASQGACEFETGMLAERVFRKGSDVGLITVRMMAVLSAVPGPVSQP